MTLITTRKRQTNDPRGNPRPHRARRRSVCRDVCTCLQSAKHKPTASIQSAHAVSARPSTFGQNKYCFIHGASASRISMRCPLAHSRHGAPAVKISAYAFAFATGVLRDLALHLVEPVNLLKGLINPEKKSSTNANRFNLTEHSESNSNSPPYVAILQTRAVRAHYST